MSLSIRKSLTIIGVLFACAVFFAGNFGPISRASKALPQTVTASSNVGCQVPSPRLAVELMSSNANYAGNKDSLVSTYLRSKAADPKVAGATAFMPPTVLALGDIAFTGVIGRGTTPATDAFSFVFLVPVDVGTTIKFTDYGWRNPNFSSGGAATETEVTLVTSSAYPAGTEVKIENLSATLVGGASAGTLTFTSGTAPDGSAFAAPPFSLNGTSGDQIFAYQGSMASPTFIAGLHWNVYRTSGGDPTDTTDAAWDGVLSGSFVQASTSARPTGLTSSSLWMRSTTDAADPEKGNGRFLCGPAVNTAAAARTALTTLANWTVNDTNEPVGFALPTGCNYLGVLSSPPTITADPSPSTICDGTGTSFSITATAAVSYQWQVNTGSGFVNVTDTPVNPGPGATVFSGALTPTLTITNATAAMSGWIYRGTATNGNGTVNSNGATLTVTALPVNPTLSAKTPSTVSVADGTPVSATFTAGSGGTSCTDDYRYTVNGGASYLPYTPGANISTTGLAAGSGFVFIEGRRAGCASACQNGYVVLAAWYVTPLPAGATTLNAGDIAFSGYASSYNTAAEDNFSFVLLKNIGPGTTINFTDNGWLSTNVLQTGETTVTWTSNAAYPAGTEIKINQLTATLAAGGSAGTVTGSALSLISSGDQILAYRGPAASPTFISGIHMNVYTTANGDPVTTTAAEWDGTANTPNSSALPPGLTTGVNAIWIGTQGDINSEYSNGKYGTCLIPATFGDTTILRTALNNQDNWLKDDTLPPVFNLPTGCVYFGLGTPPSITADPSTSTICEGTNTSFTSTANGALSYQWQIDADGAGGGGFVNVTDNTTYLGATTTTLNINAAPLGLNGALYRMVATNVSGPTNSNSALLTVNPKPINPSVSAKLPAAPSVVDGTPVSSTFNAGSGGTGCLDDYRFTTNGGISYLTYTPGTNISTTGVAAGSGFVVIEGRRAACSSSCQSSYTVMASWVVTPGPAAATTLAAGDIAFSGYTSQSAADDFSFVLLKAVGAGTAINFTDNGWLSTNVFRTGEQNITWTAPAGGLAAGTEIKIAGLAVTKAGGGAAGTVTGTALSLITAGDQILAFQGAVGSPTFISAIHMNVYSTTNGDPVTTTAAAWDGTADTTSSSALPPGLTTGVNAIWIGTQGVPSSEYNNAKYGTCSSPAMQGPPATLRASLNNQANWDRDNSVPPNFTLPTGCAYLFFGSSPVANADTGSTLSEDGANGTINVLTNDTDPDGNPAAPVNGAGQFTVDLDTATAGIQTTLTNAQGSWTLANATGIVTYDPANNFNGTGTLTYTLCDANQFCSNANITFQVAAVNDAPSFVKGADQTRFKNDPAQTVNGWATSISAGPPDEAGQALNFIVTNNNNPLFSAQPAVSNTGVLTYTPANGQSGTAVVSVSLQDSGGTAGGGVNTSAIQTFNISISVLTAADVSIAGRILTVEGRGIRGAQITVTGNSLAAPITVRAGVNGTYRVDGLTAGETYVVTVQARRFTFDTPSRVLNLTDNVIDADFVSNPIPPNPQ